MKCFVTNRSQRLILTMLAARLEAPQSCFEISRTRVMLTKYSCLKENKCAHFPE